MNIAPLPACRQAGFLRRGLGVVNLKFIKIKSSEEI